MISEIAHMVDSASVAGLTFKTIGYPLLWLGVLILSLWIEAATAEMVSIWFIPGAFVSMITSLFVRELRVQVILFVVLSSVGFALAKTVFRNRISARGKILPVHVNTLIGQVAVVEEDIDNAGRRGRIRLHDSVWMARTVSEDDKPLRGQKVRVVRVVGCKLFCEPVPDQTV